MFLSCTAWRVSVISHHVCSNTTRSSTQIELLARAATRSNKDSQWNEKMIIIIPNRFVLQTLTRQRLKRRRRNEMSHYFTLLVQSSQYCSFAQLKSLSPDESHIYHFSTAVWKPGRWGAASSEIQSIKTRFLYGVLNIVRAHNLITWVENHTSTTLLLPYGRQKDFRRSVQWNYIH